MNNDKPQSSQPQQPSPPKTRKVQVVLHQSVNFPDNGGSFKNFNGLYDTARGILIVEMKDGSLAEMSIHSANVMGVKFLK